MRRKPPLRGPWLLMLAVLTGACASGGAPGTDAKEQLRFGVEMARRGLWSEALFRFEQTRRLDPGDPSALNNIAVAYEAVGRFEDALAVYKEAVAVAPGNRDVKTNYSRFLEFYQGYRGVKLPAAGGGAEPPAEPVPPPPAGAPAAGSPR
jgi:Tfp pilus assembly protein PilF